MSSTNLHACLQGTYGISLGLPNNYGSSGGLPDHPLPCIIGPIVVFLGNRMLAWFIITIIILIGFSMICLLGLRESSTLTLSIFTLHAVTMAVVMVTSIIMWGKGGSQTLIDNWTSIPDPEGSNPAHLIFNGLCIGLLGVTGFEVYTLLLFARDAMLTDRTVSS